MELITLIWLVAATALAWPHDEVASQRVTLLPSTNGEAGAVVVSTAGIEHLLNKPYASLDVMHNGTAIETTSAPSEVDARYGLLLQAQPPRPQSFQLYFVNGSDRQLTPESINALASLQTYLQSRPAPEVTVIGHTDRTGQAAANDALSLKRALSVRELIHKAGIATDNIPALGRGAREPLVTGDQEHLNRRVEIHVRCDLPPLAVPIKWK